MLFVRDPNPILEGDVKEINAEWLKPRPIQVEELTEELAKRRCADVLSSWVGKFHFREEKREGEEVIEIGLRPPQIGALYGILAHWKASSAPATVVMPTGTGKTETMLALLARERLSRLLVVVPTNALRDQIGEKFISLGLLKKLGALDDDAMYPVVGLIQHKPKNTLEVEKLFSSCNVIVTTMAIAGQCDELIQAKMAELCSHLFIDEAHHISAKTWDAFRKHFKDRPVVQFTATPFRNDGRHVDGKLVFNYPLKKAQIEGYFKPIRFTPVDELDPAEVDFQIATTAITQLKADNEAGFKHLVMARCSDIPRAVIVHKLYAALAPELNPVILHNKVPKVEAAEALKNLRAGENRIVVCVDMLGEGFDLPELKIAALHDPHKSLAITLQFTGRFTRTRADLGDATMIANIADPSVGEALQELYAEDADWNVLLRDLSEGANTRQARRSEFLDAFQNLPEAVSLRNIFPKMSAAVYRTGISRWRPERAVSAMGSTEIHAGPTTNERDKVVLFITRERESVAWGDVRDIRNTEWHLYLIHWSQSQGLLFINSSNKSSLHEDLAIAIGGDNVDLIRGETVFRSLHNMQRLVLTNLGLSDVVNENLRFSLHVGSDISDVLPNALRENKKKSNTFGRGYEDGVPVTMGCSQKGRVWSMATATDLSDWVEWCHAVGKKLKDDSISTADVFKNVILPETLKKLPELIPLLVDWPESFLQRPEDNIEVEIDGEAVLFFDAELSISRFSSDGPIRFAIATQTKRAEYEFDITDSKPSYNPTGTNQAIIRIGRTKAPLTDWFLKNPPAIRFEDGSYLEHNELFRLPTSTQRRPFDKDKIEAWDWTGVDLKQESQKLTKNPSSIQRRVLDTLLGSTQDPPFDIIFDDDGSGEAADIVCIGVRDNRLVVHLYHCKYSKETTPGARVEDLYEVCGQSQRSVHWRSSSIELLKHLRRRDEGRRTKALKLGAPHVTRFERGDIKVVRDLLKRAPYLVPEFKIFAVQPGLSKTSANNNQLDLLGATQVYLMDTSAVTFAVIASQ